MQLPHCEEVTADPTSINPITGSAACCARAKSGHEVAAPPSSVTNVRRFTRSPRQRATKARPVWCQLLLQS